MTAGNGSTAVWSRNAVDELDFVNLPAPGRTGLSVALDLLGNLAPSSLCWLALLSALYLCDSSFHPDELKDPLRISAKVGAFDAALPVAAHMPGGGSASISFILAVRMLLVADAMEVLVEVRGRRGGEVGEVGEALVWGWESGCGKGTGVGTSTLDGEVAMPTRNDDRIEELCV